MGTKPFYFAEETLYTQPMHNILKYCFCDTKMERQKKKTSIVHRQDIECSYQRCSQQIQGTKYALSCALDVTKDKEKIIRQNICS